MVPLGVGRRVSIHRFVGRHVGGFVGWLVSWDWVAGLSRVLWVVVGLPFISDISVVAVIVGYVTDDLGATVGQRHLVRALGSVAVPLLLVAKVSAGVVVRDSVSEGVGGWPLRVVRVLGQMALVAVRNE